VTFQPRHLATRRALLGAALASPLVARWAQAAGLPALAVWKDRSCTCCGGWIAHMRTAGFPAAVAETDDMEAVKRRFAVPDALQSCHTATVDGYVLEGHVPAQDVRRLLTERPAARGLAAPGMPASAPGMDLPGQPYRVILFGTVSGDRVFAQH